MFRGVRNAASIPAPPSSDKQAVFSDYDEGPLEIALWFDGSTEQAHLFPIGLEFAVEKDSFLASVRPRLQVERPDLGAAFVHGGLLLDGPNGRPLADLHPLHDLLDWLLRAVYIPAFRNALPLDNPRAGYYDSLVGRQLIGHWHELKSGDARAGHELAQRLTDDTRRIFGLRTLEINASQDGQTLRLTVNGRIFAL